MKKKMLRHVSSILQYSRQRCKTEVKQKESIENKERLFEFF